MSESNLDGRRQRWLQEAKKLALLVTERRGLMTDTCPSYCGGDRDEKLRDLVRCGRDIDQCVTRLPEIESDPDGVESLGSAALLTKPTIEETAVVALMTVARLSAAADREFFRLSDLMDSVAGGDPSVALTVRGMFSQSGRLRPFTRIDRVGPTVDLWCTTLTETSFASVLGHEPDAEAIALANGLLDEPQRRRR